jgi:hypothetical protein
MKLSNIWRYGIVFCWALSFFHCSQYFGNKPERIDPQVLDLLRAGIGNQASANCSNFAVAPIRGGVGTITGNSNGSRQGFNVSGCGNSSALSNLGFPNQNLVFPGDGVVGNSTSSSLVSLSDYPTLGSKSQSMEVTFRLDRADAYLDVVVAASAAGNTPVGPRFRITADNVSIINSENQAQGIIGSVRNKAGVAQVRTYCFDTHDHSGGHLIGWSQSCASLSDRDRAIGGYEFERPGIQGTLPGFKFGLIINGATVRQMIPGEMIAPH